MTSASSQIRSLLLLAIVFCGSGATCNRALRNPFSSAGPPMPEVLAEASSLEQVTAAVNQNAQRIVSYQTNNARITIPGMPGIPLLRGNIAAKPPANVRLQASTALTGAEVDLGANDELFWFWVKRNEPPALYFSRHDQFAGSAAQQVMPIEPQWLLDAMGMTQFSPSDRHEGPFPYGDDALEIRSIMQTRSGQMSKSTIIDGRTAVVLEQHIYDAAGTLVASTRGKNHRYYPSVGVSLPQDIELRVPATQLSLSIDVGDVQLNAITDNPALWTLPVLPGYPQIDLGTAQPGSVPAMGAIGSRDPNTFAAPSFVGIETPNSGNAAPVLPPIAPGVYAPSTLSGVPATASLPRSPASTYSPVLPSGESLPVTPGLRPGGGAVGVGL